MENAKGTVRLPDLGDVGEVVVVEWLKREGEHVGEGEDLVEVETEKTAFVVPAPATGRLRVVAARPGDRLRVGGTLGEIEPE
jgi:pyruvate/2-oxoglutarate dehydrogenase complex dihydrolipoamide acyltransferase (E2) component